MGVGSGWETTAAEGGGARQPEGESDGDADGSAEGGVGTGAEAEVEGWRLTLVLELCSEGSLRRCLAEGALGSAAAAAAAATAAAAAAVSATAAAEATTAARQLPEDQCPYCYRFGDCADVGLPTLQCCTSTQVLLSIVLDAARALSYLHAAGVVHGDISSSNVLLTRRTTSTAASPSGMYGIRGSRAAAAAVPWVAKLCDFGLSVRPGRDRTHVTGGARRCCAYSAPELTVQGRCGYAGDCYAWGVLVWEVAAGVPLPELLSCAEGRGVQDWLESQRRRQQRHEDDDDGGGSRAEAAARLAATSVEAAEVAEALAAVAEVEAALPPKAHTRAQADARTEAWHAEEVDDLTSAASEAAEDLAAAVAAQAALPPNALCWPPGVPAVLVALVGACLAVDPWDRPTAADLVVALERLTVGLRGSG
ncbi:putative serine/threonine-protein kinase [Tetrabaena socialis]|uniref:Putative serine/threonine-protein kinase n=1 Tax=Tetrabaena socialis TaxID=47790 RepID=A0A2J7ZN09_9CHLO|nr:putative serine/threonine-protein kinase [Tetrabaena socialis]|eukprot:PNH01640.1 putative serine/threonine-protein kinase [Tetrabaena socialis]